MRYSVCFAESAAEKYRTNQPGDEIVTEKNKNRNKSRNKNKNKMNLRIRIASEEDAQALLALYAPYVEYTAITFEYEVPSVEEFRERIRETMRKYPYLVLEADGVPAGYAYASPFHDRPAYDWAVETSIYMGEQYRKIGGGRLLHEGLEEALRLQGIRNMNACIAYPKEEDEYLTKNSVEFHAHLCYRLVGEFYQCGYKFGRWYDMVWMEKLIGPHEVPTAPIRPFPEIREQAAAMLAHYARNIKEV